MLVVSRAVPTSLKSENYKNICAVGHQTKKNETNLHLKASFQQSETPTRQSF